MRLLCLNKCIKALKQCVLPSASLLHSSAILMTLLPILDFCQNQSLYIAYISRCKSAGGAQITSQYKYSVYSRWVVWWQTIFQPWHLASSNFMNKVLQITVRMIKQISCPFLCGLVSSSFMTSAHKITNDANDLGRTKWKCHNDSNAIHLLKSFCAHNIRIGLERLEDPCVCSHSGMRANVLRVMMRTTSTPQHCDFASSLIFCLMLQRLWPLSK